MTESDLSKRFPNMTPISGPPTMMRINGCGTGVYGTRDRDAESGTYVTTLCLCLVFIPVIPLRAYRIADAPTGGWYFLGREPLSRFCRAWNWLLGALTLTCAAAIAWDGHFNSPEQRAARELESARALVAQDRFVEGARALDHVSVSGTESAASAKHELVALFTRDFARARPDEGAKLIGLLAGALRRGPLPDLDAAEVFKRGAAQMEALAPADARGAVALANALTPLAPDAPAHARRRLALLQVLHDRAPDDLDIAVELADLTLEAHDPPRAVKLLAPHAQALGTGEGARILGLAYAATARVEEGVALLDPYVQARLATLHQRSKAYDDAAKTVQDRALDDLKQGRAPRSFFTEYDHSDEPEQHRMVQSFIRTRLNQDANVAAALTALHDASSVVPVALELGELRLQRAERLEPAKRKPELEAAERVFLAIRDVAGETDAYRLYYGQVCYWLGRPKQGQELFDQLLASKKRSPDMLAQVASTLREVGDSAQARALSEEAYGAAKEPATKEHLARLRAVLFTSLDDEQRWLERAGKGTETLATLAQVRGQRAIQAGDDARAATELRAAVDGFASLPRNAASLNNGSIAAFALASLTGEAPAYDQALGMLEDALALEPGDSILLQNAAERQIDRGCRQLLPAGLLTKLVETEPASEHLGLLYRDQASCEKTGASLMANAAIRLGIARYQKVLLLAPKEQHAYRELSVLYWMAGDAAALDALTARARAAQIDPSADDEAIRKDRDKRDAEVRDTCPPAVARLAKVLNGTGADASPVSFAMGAMKYADLQTSLAIVGAPVDADELVRIAEKAVRLWPADATRRNLREAFGFRALRRLLARPEAARVYAAVRRDLYPCGQLAVVLWKAPGLREEALKDADVERVCAGGREREAAFPGQCRGFDAFLTWLSDPAQARRAVAAMRNNRVIVADRAMDRVVNPTSLADALSDALTELVDTGDAAATAALTAARARGVVVPAGL